MTYTEADVMAAWDRTFAKTYATPAPLVRGDFQAELRKGKPVLFSKEDLLAAARTPYERMVVHGIFAILGTEMANDVALTQTVRDAPVGLVMKMLMDLVRGA